MCFVGIRGPKPGPTKKNFEPIILLSLDGKISVKLKVKIYSPFIDSQISVMLGGGLSSHTNSLIKRFKTIE